MSTVYYNSVREFVDACPKSEGERAKERHEYYKKRKVWFGSQSYKATLKNVFNGYALETAELADKMLDKLESDGIETPRRVWQHEIAGMIPCIPSYLAGVPDSMRVLTDTLGESSPVRVYLSVGTSAWLDADSITKRGIACLALCRKLMLVRPVELYIMNDLGSYNDDGYCIPVIKLETSPLDMTLATYCITSPAFMRHLTHSWGDDCNRGFNGGWSFGISPNDDKYMPKLRAALGASPTDLVIKGGFSGDPIISNPVKWVNEQIQKYLDADKN